MIAFFRTKLPLLLLPFHRESTTELQAKFWSFGSQLLPLEQTPGCRTRTVVGLVQGRAVPTRHLWVVACSFHTRQCLLGDLDR
jgi:hypothetical protein